MLPPLLTANNQFNDHDQNLGGGHVDIFCLSSKTTGGDVPPPPVPYTPPAHGFCIHYKINFEFVQFLQEPSPPFINSLSP